MTPFFVKLATHYPQKIFIYLITNQNRSLIRPRNLLIQIFLVITLVFSLSTLFAQNPEPVYRRYNVDNGLPSSQVYHVFQDSKGYIWFATGNGVSRYDGYKFENFDLQSGLVDNDVFEIYEDYKHRIWFIPMSGRLCYFENNKIISYKYNNKIKGHLPVSRGPIKCSFYVDSLDYVYLSLKKFGLISISPEGILKKDEDSKNISLKVDELANGKILISNHENPQDRLVIFKGLYQNFTISLTDITPGDWFNHHHLFFHTMPDSSLVCSFLQMIFQIKNGKFLTKINNHQDVIWMNLDDNSNLWVALQSGGVQCFPNYDIKNKSKMTFLQNVQVSSVLKDKEGAYWFSTLNDGVFYCSNINFINYTHESGLEDNRINAIGVRNKDVYIGYDFGFVDKLNNDNIQHFNSGIKAYNPSVRSFLIDSLNNKVWICAIDNLYMLQNNKVIGISEIQNNLNIFPRRIINSNKGGYWIGATKGLLKMFVDKVTYDSYGSKDFVGMIFDLVEEKNGVVWFCTLNGLWKYSKGNFQYLGTENSLLAHAGSSLILNPVDSSVWMGTNGAGIVVKSKQRVYQITKEDGLISNSIHQLFYYNKNIWVATRQGLSRIELGDGKFSIQNFTNANGLPTNEVSSVCEFKNIVYVGTSKGLTIFDKVNISENKTPPSVIISNFRVNNRQIDFSSPRVVLKHDQNSLNFDFVGFVYRNEGRVKYRYRMLGVDSSWVQSSTPNCLYSSLTNGDYKFEVEAQSYSGVWSATPASISFTIQPPFWKRTWFLFIGSLIFSLIIFFIFRIRVNSIKRRNELIQNINLYKQQSLRQQMNPHFIFNTLNSIQLYILEKDPISSHKYLTKFARLMRMTLDNSLNSTIPLRDEIEALKLYLDLEKLRLEGKFDYTIDYGADQNILNYKIPTLLIQPFVENAIWHGIMLKQNQSGWVKINLTDNGNSLCCSIEDNGIGRSQADAIRQLRNKDHKSRGSQITQQRIELLSLMYKEKFNIYYEDLFDHLDNPLGTRVSITFPKEINVNIQK